LIGFVAGLGWASGPFSQQLNRWLQRLAVSFCPRAYRVQSMDRAQTIDRAKTIYRAKTMGMAARRVVAAQESCWRFMAQAGRSPQAAQATVPLP